MSDQAAVDRFLEESLLAVSAYVDLDEAAAAIRECLQAVHKQAAALNATDYKTREIKLACGECKKITTAKAPWKPDELARAMAHTAKVLDEVTRLAAFAKGQPDSRPDLGGGNRDILSLLTPEQFGILETWIEAARGRA